jgi:hypothetical protein
MSIRPEGWPADQPFEQMSQERFEQVLLGVRNAATVGLLSGGDAVGEDQRAVWHAAEIALAMLIPGYEPKREALAEARVLEGFPQDDDE